MKFIKVIRKEFGQSLIELLITIALVSLILPALLTGFAATRGGRAQQDQRLSALYYLKESQEALRVVQANGWTFIASGTFHPVATATSWSLVSGSESLESGNYTRKIVLSAVSRDPSGNIVTSGGIVDPSTKLATITVSWSTPTPQSVSEISYLTRHINLNHTDTTTPDFSGTLSGTAVVATTGTSIPQDAQIQLGAGGHGNWCNPNLSIAALDLPKNGVANAISAIPGQVFAGTGENASGVSFANINVTNTNPPTSQILGTYDGYKTNGVFGESNYAYLATDNNSKEVVIIDLTQLNPVTNKYAEVGYFNAPGNGSGRSIYVQGSVGYMTDANKLYTFNLTSKTGSRAQLATITLAANGSKVVVNGSYAFVSIEGATQELQIIQVSNGGATLSIVGSADVNGQAAHDVSVNSTGTRAYLATGVDASKKEFFIVDTSSKSGSRPIVGSYEANGMDPKAVTVVTGNKAILVGIGAEEYQVIDISNESAPVRCGGLNINTGINGIASVLEADSDTYSYIITGDSASELKIIEGGPGGQFATSGTYTSPIFDAGADVAFNKFTVGAATPSATTLTYQIGIAHAINGNCSGVSVTFIGPDGTAGTTFATGSAIPISTYGSGYENPGQCFRYKATFNTTDSSQTPILYDFSFNYSP